MSSDLDQKKANLVDELLELNNSTKSGPNNPAGDLVSSFFCGHSDYTTEDLDRLLAQISAKYESQEGSSSSAAASSSAAKEVSPKGKKSEVASSNTATTGKV